MPELPDIVVYLEALDQRILGQRLKSINLGSPFLLRTAEPPLATVHGLKVVTLRRLGKRICFGFENELWLVLHLMIAGRLHWKDATNKTTKKGTAAKLPNKRNLATFEFQNGTLSLTEAGTQRRASLHLLQGEAGLERLNPGGLEVLECELSQFASVLQSANHTLKRALTDPRLFSGIGNAYSDEILWHAQLSPIALTQKLHEEEIERLFNSTRAMLSEWVELFAPTPTESFLRRSRRFGRRWRCTGSIRSRVRAVAARCAAFATLLTKQIIVRDVRLEGSCWQIARSRVSCAPTGRGLRKNWKD